MRALIEVDCDTISELMSHLGELRRQIRKEYRKKKLNPLEDEFELETVLEDNNCYGTHECTIVPEPL